MFSGSPFLKSGITLAIFIFLRKIPFSRDRLNKCFRGSLISLKHFLTTLKISKFEWSKMADNFTKENMKTLIKEIFQEEFKKHAENITNLISGNFKLMIKESHGLKNEANDLKKSLQFTQKN